MLALLSMNIIAIAAVESFNQPNIIIILADDLGYNDVGFHGNNQVKTPNIDALAYNGVILNKFYTLPTCTPSRAALLTGNYPIRSGLQGFPLSPGEERHIPWDMPTMPEQLKKLGYKTHLIGKWHLGHAYKNATPLMRGFDSHYGYYNGYIGYFDHEIVGRNMRGLDFRDNFVVAIEDSNKYATDLFTARSVKIIRDHDYGKPLFLLVSHLAAHTGKTVVYTHTILEERDTKKMNRHFGYVKDVNRRRYIDIVKSLDDSVGIVVKTLSEIGVLDNTIILFMSDNGGQIVGAHKNYASNWPLRGGKFSHFEGAIKGLAVLYSKNITSKGINNNLVHISDFMPTFYTLGGGNLVDLGVIDGINQLQTLFFNESTKRKDILININEIANMSGIISYSGRYKLVQGSIQNKGYNMYSGDAARNREYPNYDIESVLQSDVNTALLKYKLSRINKYNIYSYRNASTTFDCRSPSTFDTSCHTPCLFDLLKDSCETRNIADDHPDIVKELQNKIFGYFVDLVPQQNKHVDPKSNPDYFNGCWSTWLDENPI